MKLESANQELLNSNILIQKFASVAAHDIKNPLSSILLTSQALKKRHEQMQDEACIRLVDININSAKSLLKLVDEMLEYSKTPSLLIARKTKFNLSNFIKRVLALLTLPEHFEINLPDDEHELYVSIVALEQILINLLSNAIRYNDKPKGIIQIRFNEDLEYYNLEVEDNGIGIAEQYYEQIFENNFTLEIKDRYDQKGSGIGLSTVKELIKLLDGKIGIESKIDHGTTFFISIKK